MAEVIVITSGKGGVGKTTTTANLAVALALQKNRVVMIDTDIGLRNLDVVLGVENRIVYDLVDVAEGICPMQQALLQDKRYEGLFFLPAAQNRDKDAMDAGKMRTIVEHLQADFDYVLIDCPAGIEQGFKNAVAAAHKAIVVTVPEMPAVRDADRIVGLLEIEGIQNIQLLINRYRSDLVHSGDMLSKETIAEQLDIPLLGVIPEDSQVIRAANRGQPIVEGNSPAALEYRNVALHVLGREVPVAVLEQQQPKRSFMGKLRGIFGRKE